jgi:DNA repair photolyase
MFEPNAASIDSRLGQMEMMVTGSIAVEARIMPILPGITDKPDSISSLFRAIASTGVKRTAISSLFLRPAIVGSLKRHVSDKVTLEKLLDFYTDVRRLPVHAGHSSVTPVPRQKREEIYSRFSQIARKYDINLSICGCMNPDIGGTCNIAGKWLTQDIQSSLFIDEG